MTDDWMRAEEATERRRNRGWYRNQPPTYDPTEHTPTQRDRLEVEPPLTQKEES